jgi:hypothetical protein
MHELQHGRNHKSDHKCAAYNVPKRWNSEQKYQHTPDREHESGEITAHRQPVHRDASMRMFGVFVLHRIPLLPIFYSSFGGMQIFTGQKRFARTAESKVKNSVKVRVVSTRFIS